MEENSQECNYLFIERSEIVKEFPIKLNPKKTEKLKKIKLIDKSYLMEFSANNAQKKNLIEKASILINGVSLTISKITKNGFEVWIIPHTYKLTNLSKLKKNSLANIEIDILSKYIKKYFNEK